jgi:Leucine-rich repeat (LRR) protein
MSTINPLWSNWDKNITTTPDYIFNSKEGESVEWEVADNSLNTPSRNNLISFKTYDQKCKGDVNLNDCSLLEFVEIQNAQLENLNVEGLNNLSHLDLQNNSLKDLNANNLQSLKLLLCQNNSLSSLNTNGLFNLTHLHCYNNNLTELNLLELANLQSLDCQNNNLNQLNVSNNTQLFRLLCNHNALTSLDISSLTNLEMLNCSSNLIEGNLTGLSAINRDRVGIDITKNNMSVENLNQIFEQLPNNPTQGKENWVLVIQENPGTEDCDKTIATNKGWTIK